MSRTIPRRVIATWRDSDSRTGIVSVKHRQISTKKISASTTCSAKTTSHPHHTARNPPATGVIAEVSPITTMVKASMRAVPAGSWVSRITARPATWPTDTARACTKRAMVRESIEGATIQIALAAAISTMPPNNKGRRPNTSTNGPDTSCPMANPAR